MTPAARLESVPCKARPIARLATATSLAVWMPNCDSTASRVTARNRVMARPLSANIRTSLNSWSNRSVRVQKGMPSCAAASCLSAAIGPRRAAWSISAAPLCASKKCRDVAPRAAPRNALGLRSTTGWLGYSQAGTAAARNGSIQRASLSFFAASPSSGRARARRQGRGRGPTPTDRQYRSGQGRSYGFRAAASILADASISSCGPKSPSPLLPLASVKRLTVQWPSSSTTL